MVDLIDFVDKVNLTEPQRLAESPGTLGQVSELVREPLAAVVVVADDGAMLSDRLVICDVGNFALSDVLLEVLVVVASIVVVGITIVLECFFPSLGLALSLLSCDICSEGEAECVIVSVDRVFLFWWSALGDCLCPCLTEDLFEVEFDAFCDRSATLLFRPVRSITFEAFVALIVELRVALRVALGRPGFRTSEEKFELLAVATISFGSNAANHTRLGNKFEPKPNPRSRRPARFRRSQSKRMERAGAAGRVQS